MNRFVAATAAGMIAIAIGCFRDTSSPPPIGASPSRSETVLAFSGLTFNETCAGARNSVLSIDALEVRDRKLGPFAMRGIAEVEMRGVRARLASCPVVRSDEAQSAEGPRVDEFLALPVRNLALGFVSRVSAQPAELVFHDGGGDLLRIEAGRIDLALGSGALQLGDGVVIRARDGGELRAARAEWQVGDGTLRVPGPHEFAGAAGPRRAGGDGRFALHRSGTLRFQP